MDEIMRALPEILEEAGNGAGVMMHDDDGLPMVTLYPPKNLPELLDDEHLFIFSMSQRPGALRFFHELEHTFFAPGTELNMKYSMLYVNWSDMMWIGVRIPISMKNCADITANRTGMHVSDGIPTIISGGGVCQFPLNGQHVYTLENAKGSKVYDGMSAAEEMRKDELIEINKEYRQ
jgi:hypothetical protein